VVTSLHPLFFHDALTDGKRSFLPPVPPNHFLFSLQAEVVPFHFLPSPSFPRTCDADRAFRDFHVFFSCTIIRYPALPLTSQNLLICSLPYYLSFFPSPVLAFSLELRDCLLPFFTNAFFLASDRYSFTFFLLCEPQLLCFPFLIKNCLPMCLLALFFHLSFLLDLGCYKPLPPFSPLSFPFTSPLHTRPPLDGRPCFQIFCLRLGKASSRIFHPENQAEGPPPAADPPPRTSKCWDSILHAHVFHSSCVCPMKCWNAFLDFSSSPSPSNSVSWVHSVPS